MNDEVMCEQAYGKINVHTCSHSESIHVSVHSPE